MGRAVSITCPTFTRLFLEDVARPAESRFPSCVSTEKSRFQIPIYMASLPPAPPASSPQPLNGARPACG